MTTRPGGDRDQAVGTLLDGLVSELIGDHIMQRDAAIGMRRLVHLWPCAERSDQNRHLMLHAHLQIRMQAVIGFVHDLIDGEGGGQAVWMAGIVFAQFALNPDQPLLQHMRRTGVQRGKRADNARFALRDHQIRGGDDEHRRADHRQPQRLQNGGQAHAGVSRLFRMNLTY